MKELSIEEKAKRYDEAIIRGSRLWESDTITRENYEYIFPELKEESEDEKIRKAIIGYIDHGQHYGVSNKDMISWLKKQGEQKSWSEEDEIIALSIEQVMNCASLLNIVPEKIDKIRTWLKSLKERYTWKPSDEQMKALQVFLAHGCAAPDKEASIAEEVVDGLYNDLKKLRGE